MSNQALQMSMTNMRSMLGKQQEDASSAAADREQTLSKALSDVRFFGAWVKQMAAECCDFLAITD
jgi:hypothetical protein